MVGVSSTRHYSAARKRVQPNPVDPNTHRRIRYISWIILSLSLLLLIWCKVNDPDVMPIRSVKIKGQYEHVDKLAIQKAVLPFLKSGFVNVDTEGLKKVLQTMPWVQEVIITRAWPDKLVITLAEHNPVAQWNIQNLLDNTGIVFAPGDITNETLPLLNGPDGQHLLVWQNYQRLNAQLAPLGLNIAQLYLSARQAWNLTLSNGVKIILGRVSPETRLHRLITAYPQIVGSHSSDIDYIDMRYTSGMAVKWKTNSSPA